MTELAFKQRHENAGGGPAKMELAELAPDSVIVFDLAGKIRYWNPASERLYGWPSIGAVGRSIIDISTASALQFGQWSSLL